MSQKETTRDNHYVPIWHQRGFLPKNENKLHYLDMSPKAIHLKTGEVRHDNDLFWSYPSQCFYQTDLYTTFFGTFVNDEIEKKLFGSLDAQGAPAIQAFLTDDVSEWHHHFQEFFLYLDAQKIRTPKGLDWIKTRYPRLDQNALMIEMQAIRAINCTIWSECVREIVSSHDASVKFILTDHPVTIFNYACPPEHELCWYPSEPSVALKASQTLFPLDQEQCLILTHLEYAEAPDATAPLEKRTYARQVRQSLARTDRLIKQRSLNDTDVTAINHILKSRARRFVAAGSKDWLWPERDFRGDWRDIKRILLPPKGELWHFGGETFVGFEDGSVHYQDAYGRSTPQTKFLDKSVKESDLGVNEACGCGSGWKYKNCCKGKPERQRTSWRTLSVRERNLALFRGINAILGIDVGKTWRDVRSELDSDKVRRIHELYGYLWPVETDIFELLPKPDGRTRALYSGLLDPRTTPLSVSNAALYLGNVLVQSPFTHPKQVRKEYSPVDNPHQYLSNTLKNLLLFFEIFPLIERGHVNLFPDPASIDPHLQRYVIELAESRSKGTDVAERDVAFFERLRVEDFQRILSALPKDMQERQVRRADPEASDDHIREFLRYLEEFRRDDPLSLLREDVYGGVGGGQLLPVQMAPNFELMLLIAQATDAIVVTDSHHRWSELRAACHRDEGLVRWRLGETFSHVAATTLPVGEDTMSNFDMLSTGKVGKHRQWVEMVKRCISERGGSLFDDHMSATFDTSVVSSRRDFGKKASSDVGVKLQYMAPVGGIYHNHVQRLMVRCGIDDRPDRVSLAALMDFVDE